MGRFGGPATIIGVMLGIAMIKLAEPAVFIYFQF
jgi:hypothetical protein